MFSTFYVFAWLILVVTPLMGIFGWRIKDGRRVHGSAEYFSNLGTSIMWGLWCAVYIAIYLRVFGAPELE